MRIYPAETIQKSMIESTTTVSNVSGYWPLYVAYMYITLWRFIRTLRKTSISLYTVLFLNERHNRAVPRIFCLRGQTRIS